MVVDADPIAILILEILADLPRGREQIEGQPLLVLLKERSGDNTLQSYHVKDAVEILRIVHSVRVHTAMDPRTNEFGFIVVSITPLGRNYLKAKAVS